MGLLHRRELLIVRRRVSRLGCAVALAAATACGGGETPGRTSETPETEAPPRLAESAVPGDTAAADVTLLGAIPNGSPMPAASRAGGIPPYPGAVVHTRLPRNRPGLRSFEAFTPDSWSVVQAHYDTVLGPAWTKIDAEDTTVYQKEDDQAAITLTPWVAADLPTGTDHPAVLRDAHTIIGVAWRTAPADR